MLSWICQPQRFFIIAAWLILSTALLFTCGIPKEIDFERYMSISQYIYTHHEYILLHFNDAIYTDKPPLMFWLIAAGWHIWGVHVWWPYVILCFFSGGSVMMTYHIAKILYKNDPEGIEKAYRAPLFLLALVFFGMASAELRVDALLLFFSLLIHYGCLQLCQNSNQKKACFAIFCGIGLGLLSKGPVVFVTGLLPALIGLWASKQKILIRPILFSVLLGLLPVVLWLIPACLQGGKAYTDDVLFGQIAHRAERNDTTIFFYLLRLPGYLFPFLFFPSIWKALINPGNNRISRYTLSGILFLFVIFSLFGQKAMHYLLPTMPLWAIFLAGTVEYGKREIEIFKVVLWVAVFSGLFIMTSQTGIGLQWLKYLAKMTYTFYLVTQSFQTWQLMGFSFLSIFLLIALYKYPKALLSVVVCLSILVQINIQILNFYYFQARFFTYFQENIQVIQQLHKTYTVSFSPKENKDYCAGLLPQEVVQSSTTNNPDYLISNERCLFFNARTRHANPEAIFIPQMQCAYGLWKMNENTRHLLQFCSKN